MQGLESERPSRGAGQLVIAGSMLGSAAALAGLLQEIPSCSLIFLLDRRIVVLSLPCGQQVCLFQRSLKLRPENICQEMMGALADVPHRHE